MAQYIDKSTLVSEIENMESSVICEFKSNKSRYSEGSLDTIHCVKAILDTLEVKTDKENSLEKFKSLQHISRDLHQILEDWGYAPNLYFFDGMWHVSWISCEEGDGIKDFEGNTPEEVINKAYDWFHLTFCNS